VRAYNFCAGPAALPTAVLERARDEMLNYQGMGVSIMEMSHRDPRFQAVASNAEANLRKLLAVPDDYAVLFTQGGASAQFSAIPLNLAGLGDAADYLVTGTWSNKAAVEAERYLNVNVVAKSSTEVPDVTDWQLDTNSSYFHYAANETIGGIEIFDTPHVGKPVVVDMSSNILSRPIDVSDFDVIYAGAQKNIGPAGLTLVIVKRSLLGHASEHCPSTMNWKNLDDNGSMFNTPPTYSWYLAGLVFEWLLDQGGLAAIQRVNQAKAEKLYRFIDSSSFFSNPVIESQRSTMNIPFLLANSDLDRLFLEEAESVGLMNLKGHRSVGGMRASIYNAVSEEAVDSLIAFMAKFEQRHR